MRNILKPPKSKLDSMSFLMEMLEERVRRQDERTDRQALTDDTKRAVMMDMYLVELEKARLTLTGTACIQMSSRRSWTMRGKCGINRTRWKSSRCRSTRKEKATASGNNSAPSDIPRERVNGRTNAKTARAPRRAPATPVREVVVAGRHRRFPKEDGPKARQGTCNTLQEAGIYGDGNDYDGGDGCVDDDGDEDDSVGDGVGGDAGAEDTHDLRDIELCAVEEVQGGSAGQPGANNLDDLPPGLANLDHFDPWAKYFDPASEYDPWVELVRKGHRLARASQDHPHTHAPPPPPEHDPMRNVA